MNDAKNDATTPPTHVSNTHKPTKATVAAAIIARNTLSVCPLTHWNMPTIITKVPTTIATGAPNSTSATPAANIATLNTLTAPASPLSPSSPVKIILNPVKISPNNGKSDSHCANGLLTSPSVAATRPKPRTSNMRMPKMNNTLPIKLMNALPNVLVPFAANLAANPYAVILTHNA